MYVCSNCGYETASKSDFQSHLESRYGFLCRLVGWGSAEPTPPTKPVEDDRPTWDR